MAWTVRPLDPDRRRWLAALWDPARVEGGLCDGGAMRYREFESEEEGKRWARVADGEFLTQLRAEAAWEAGAPCANRAWAKWYALYAYFERVEAEHG